MSGLSADVAEATKEARKHLLAALLRANVDATVWRETAERLDALVDAAHARGVAEERERWEAGLTRKSESWHEKYHGLLRVTWAQCKTYTCMKDRSILAAMAPTSPSDAPGAAEGDGTA